MIRDSAPAFAPTFGGSLELSDGRRLTYSVAGPAHGAPVVYLHGAVGSPRWHSPDLARAIAALGVRFVVVNRPGFGGSDPLPGRTVVAHAREVEALVDNFGWERFSLLGVSAGAPYALACAWALAERLVAVAAVSPFAPPPLARRAGAVPLRYRLPLLAFATPGLGPALADTALRALRLRRATPPRSMIDDYLACCRPWGFHLGEIEAPVILWHARRDRLVPPSHTRQLAAALRAPAFELEPRGGHFFFRRRAAEILETLIASPDASPTALPAAA